MKREPPELEWDGREKRRNDFTGHRRSIFHWYKDFGPIRRSHHHDPRGKNQDRTFLSFPLPTFFLFSLHLFFFSLNNLT